MVQLVVTSTRTNSPEHILLDRERGIEEGPGPKDAYRHSADDFEFAEAARRLVEETSGSADGGRGRSSNRSSMYGVREFLAFTFGTREQEVELHRTLRAYRARAREYYHPVQPVLDLVNEWRANLGRPPIQPAPPR